MSKKAPAPEHCLPFPMDLSATQLSPELMLELLPLALAKGLTQPKDLAPGQYQLRGLATIAVDVWIEKKAGYDAAVSMPAKEVLTIALGLAVKDPEELESILKQAVKKQMADSRKDAAPAELALERAKELWQDKMGKQPREGATGVKGQVSIVEFRAAQRAAA
jgi:hypothetical protein